MAIKVIFETALADIASSDIEGIGNVRHESRGDRYRWVENVSGTSMVAGSACAYPATDQSASPALYGRRISAQAAAELSGDNFAGVAMAAIAASGASAKKYGWIQVEGIHTAASVLLISSTVAGVIGDRLIPASATMDLDRLVTSVVSAGALDTTKVNVAVLMQTVDSASALTATKVAVMLRCM